MKLHLACGTNYIPEWINIDINAPSVDVKHDITQPLPFAEGSVSYIFSEHFIEHVSKPDAARIIRNCVHVLRPGGKVRISTPDLRYLAATYLSGDISQWRDVGWLPASGADFLNEAMRAWGHVYVYDQPELEALLRACGLIGIEWKGWRESGDPLLCNLECRPFHHELIVEAVKP